MRGHTITIEHRHHHVEVVVDEVKVAESDRPVVLAETGLPDRYYLPADDVRTDLLRPSPRATACPFKGDASYWSLEVGGNIHENVVWSYQDPIREAKEITGLLCFYNDRVQLTVDGERR